MKKEKKYLIYGIALVFVTLIGVSLSYFVAYIEGDKKQIGVSTADLKIIFTNGEAISGENIKPGWSITKTFSIENRSDDVFKYNISIEDLVNTFVTTGYLQYKITSTNGYNMTEYKDIPNNYYISLEEDTPIDRILAYNIEIPQGVTQEYTIELIYKNDEEVNQSEDMGAKLSGMLYISECKTPSLAEYIIDTYTLNDKVYLNPYHFASDPRISTPFSDPKFDQLNDNLYLTNFTEDGSNVYFYYGNTENNWVKFGKYKTDWYYCSLGGLYINLPTCPDGYDGEKLASAGDDVYWRIIRTNEDGGVRLLYSGTKPNDSEVVIGESKYNKSYNSDPMYVGYMYGTSGSLANNRTNENSSYIKQVLESWYRYNFYNTEYDKYVSKTAIYCNDRSVSEETYSLTYNFKYGAYRRLLKLDLPSYKCGSIIYDKDSYSSNNLIMLQMQMIESNQAIEDKFSVSTEGGGNGQLTYPIGLMTADEFYLAGGVSSENLLSENFKPWFYIDNEKYSYGSFWTMSPIEDNYNLGVYKNYGYESGLDMDVGARPVISLDKCALYASGDGSADNPYTVSAGKCKEYNYPPYDYVDPEPQQIIFD